MSHRHKFIFLKTRKTAGTSVELALSKHCGPDDIITPVTAEDEELRRELGGRGPQNHVVPGAGRDLYNHMPAQRVRTLVGQQVWDTYFTFTIERNPWDTVVSTYHWRYRDSSERPSVSEFIQTGQLRVNSRIYRIDQQIAVDKVCLYESLDEDVGEVWRRLGLPGPPKLPRAKGSFRPDQRHYREFYTSVDEARIRSLYSDAIETFGYEF